MTNSAESPARTRVPGPSRWLTLAGYAALIGALAFAPAHQVPATMNSLHWDDVLGGGMELMVLTLVVATVLLVWGWLGRAAISWGLLCVGFAVLVRGGCGRRSVTGWPCGMASTPRDDPPAGCSGPNPRRAAGWCSPARSPWGWPG